MKNEWKMWVGIAVFFLLIIGYLYYISRPPMEGGEYLWIVEEVVDGDTIRVKGSGNEMKVTIVAVDVPDDMDEQAKEYIEDELLNEWVRVKSIAEIEKDHKKGFVYISGEDVTARLIRQGLAKVDRDEKDVDVRAFIELEQEAKRAKRGVWAKEKKGAE
jgi:endonuclease YncB( thermonuclease family)